MPEKHVNGCLVCGEELVYDAVPQERECLICHRRFVSNAACPHGHYVCDACHEAGGVSMVQSVCLNAPDRDPLAVLLRLMALPDVHLHGPEHHVLVGSALLTASLSGSLLQGVEMARRGQQVPGGACGFWGCCGAAVSAGMYVSIVTGSTPLKGREWGLSNLMTARALQAIGTLGGPRCCKRDSFTAVKEAVAFTAENLDIRMELPERIVCTYSPLNAQCLGAACPYNKNHR